MTVNFIDLKPSDIREIEVFISHPNPTYCLQAPLGLFLKQGIFFQQEFQNITEQFFPTNKILFHPYLGLWQSPHNCEAKLLQCIGCLMEMRRYTGYASVLTTFSQKIYKCGKLGKQGYSNYPDQNPSSGPWKLVESLDFSRDKNLALKHKTFLSVSKKGIMYNIYAMIKASTVVQLHSPQYLLRFHGVL